MVRKFIRNIYLSTVGNFKSINEGVHLLNSHYISRNFSDIKKFERLLNRIRQSADLVSFDDAVNAIVNKDYKGCKLVAFSFDDGFEECYSMIAPSLNQNNINAAFFINPGFIDGSEDYINRFCEQVVHVRKRPMNWAQIVDLHQNGFVIGNHSYDHLRLSKVPNDFLEKQIVESKNVIEQHIKSDCEYFAWPYGKSSDINDEALMLALETHKYLFAAQGAENYQYLGMKNVFNRRHIEGDWPISHIRYFLSENKLDL